LKVLLDTDICIYVINRRQPGPLERLRAYALGEVGISVITYAELRYGVENSARAEENLQRLEQFLLPLEVAPLDIEAGRTYGRVRAQLRREGRLIGANDLFIAAHALSLGATLVTHNVREFERIEGLRLERWT
jgi:tRNA(fMet)-specific endonuclease VapC